MRRLLRVTKGIGVSDTDDISRFIPDFTTVREYTFNVWKSLYDTYYGCGCDHDEHFAGTDQATMRENFADYYPGGIDPTKPFGGYASSVHVEPGHKCYPFTGSNNVIHGSTTGKGDVVLHPSVGCGSCTSLLTNPSYVEQCDERDQFVHSLNYWVVRSIVHALQIQKCFSNQGVRDIAFVDKVRSLLHKVVNYLSTSNWSTIVGISCVDTTLGEEPGCVWTNVILIHTSDYQATSDLTFYKELSNLGLTVRFGTQKEIDAIMKHRDTILNWSFGVAQDNNNQTLNLVFSGARNHVTDQHKVVVNIDDHIMMTNAPANVGMLVDHGSDFEFGLSVWRGHRLGSIRINDTCCSINNPEALRSMGIAISENSRPSYVVGAKSGTSYTVSVKMVTKDLNIFVSSMPVLTKIDEEDINTDTTAISCEYDEISEKTSFKMTFQFNMPSDIVNYSKIYAFAIPVDMYQTSNNLGSSFLVPIEKRVVYAGFNQSDCCEISGIVSNAIINNRGAFLLRLIFDEGAFVVRQDNKEFVNPNFTAQFEIIKDDAVPASLYIWQPSRNLYWNSIIPVTMAGLMVTAAEEKYYNLNSLSSNEYRLANIGPDVPVGLRNSYNHNIKEIYGQEGGENYYYTEVLIPVPTLLNRAYKVGDYYDSIDLRIESGINAEFYLTADIISNGKHGDSTHDAYYVYYQGLRRPWLNGYIEIPLVFRKQDIITINSQKLNRTYIISVNLDINEGGDADDVASGDIDNPNLTDKTDELVTENGGDNNNSSDESKGNENTEDSLDDNATGDEKSEETENPTE